MGNLKQFDLTSREADVERVVAESVREFGKIDILINNSGRTWGGNTRRNSGIGLSEGH